MLLPEPDAPMIEITSPCSAESETPFKTWAEPKLLVMSRASIAIMICRSAASIIGKGDKGSVCFHSALYVMAKD